PRARSVAGGGGPDADHEGEAQGRHAEVQGADRRDVRRGVGGLRALVRPACPSSDWRGRDDAAARRVAIITYHDYDTPPMPTIRPISDLRNKAKEISRICHESGEPVFITKNGEGDLVVMSLAAWERQRARHELYRLHAPSARGTRLSGGSREGRLSAAAWKAPLNRKAAVRCGGRARPPHPAPRRAHAPPPRGRAGAPDPSSRGSRCRRATPPRAFP